MLGKRSRYKDWKILRIWYEILLRRKDQVIQAIVGHSQDWILLEEPLNFLSRGVIKSGLCF